MKSERGGDGEKERGRERQRESKTDRLRQMDRGLFLHVFSSASQWIWSLKGSLLLGGNWWMEWPQSSLSEQQRNLIKPEDKPK